MSAQKRHLILGGIFAGLAVAIGAFGAHALKNILLEHGKLETYELAVKYQFYHALALLIIGSAADKLDPKRLKWAARFLTGGTVIFSGSLYILSLSGNTSWGAITPIGGVLLIVGWLFFISSASK